MKVQLVVVQGKPEGKIIPLTIPVFRIGRGETCHLRPNSEQISREHAEIAVGADKVTVRDLGSRNGTIVNGKALTGLHILKDGDLVQVGPLTFALSIQGAPAAPAAVAAPKAPSLDDVSHDEIESWLVGDGKAPQPESPSGVYGGETITISAYKGGAPKSDPNARATPKAAAPAPAPAAKPAPAPAPKPAAADHEDHEYERLPEGLGDPEDEPFDSDSDSEESAPEELIDESNPFYVAKKAAQAPPSTAKATFQDTSAAANDILKRMMERKRASK